MIRFTVITVCFQAEESIRKTVESVLAQTYRNIQYLIIDGGSGDRTPEIIKKYAEYPGVRVCSEKDDGIYNAMNRGIARAEGDYIYFLNAGDCFYSPDTLERAVGFITDTSTIYYGKVMKKYAEKGAARIENRFGDLREKLYAGGMPCHQSVFAPRDTLRNHYFCEKYKIRADYEWLVYSLSQGTACREIPVIVADYDMDGLSADGKNVDLAQSETEEILHRYAPYFSDMGSEIKRRTENRWKRTAEKHLAMFLLMDRWMSLRQRKINIGDFFRQNGYDRIAVYGMGYIGERLLEELKADGIEVLFALDRNFSGIRGSVAVISPDEKFPSPDVVIVTAITSFYEIKKSLQSKVTCPVLSLDDVISGLGKKV